MKFVWGIMGYKMDKEQKSNELKILNNKTNANLQYYTVYLYSTYMYV